MRTEVSTSLQRMGGTGAHTAKGAECCCRGGESCARQGDTIPQGDTVPEQNATPVPGRALGRPCGRARFTPHGSLASSALPHFLRKQGLRDCTPCASVCLCVPISLIPLPTARNCLISTKFESHVEAPEEDQFPKISVQRAEGRR